MAPTTAPMMTRSNFAEVLTPIHKKIFFDSYNEVPLIYKKIFKVEKMDMKTQSYPHLGAFGLWQENQEGNKFNHDKFDEGDKAVFEAKRFDKAYQLTWELVQDDLYNVFKGIGKGGSAKGLGRSLRATEETETAKIILNGFSNVGYDGKALFAKDHPLINSSMVCSNLVEGPLTDETLKEALTILGLQRDEAGIVIAARASQLVVCPELEFTAKAIVHSILQAGTNNNDINTVPNLEVVVWPYLSDPTGLTKPWFVQDTSIESLKFLRREEVIFGSERIQDQMDYNMFGYTRFVPGYVDWRGIVGSMGISGTPTLGTLTASVVAGSTSTATKVSSVTGNGAGTLKYKVGSSVTKPSLNDVATDYTNLELNTDITCASGDKIVVVEVDSNNMIKKSTEAVNVVVGS